MSVSRTSHYTPRSSATHGRIVRENSTLSALLLDGTEGPTPAPASQQPSVGHTALDVVSSAINSNATETNLDSNVQSLVVRNKSSCSVNSASNISPLVQDKSVSRENSHVQESVKQNLPDPNLEASAQVDIDNKTYRQSDVDIDNKTYRQSDNKDNKDESNQYGYHSLKHSRASYREPIDADTHIDSHGGGEIVDSKTGDSGNSGVHALTSSQSEGDVANPDHVVKSVDDLNNNSNTILRSSPDQTSRTTAHSVNETVAQSTHEHVKPPSRTSSILHASTGRENSSRQSVTKETVTQSLSQKQASGLGEHQHTRLSINSQHDRVSRQRHPIAVDTLAQSVPPLDFSKLSADHNQAAVSEDFSSSIPSTTYNQGALSVPDQNLHASGSSVVHFSSRQPSTRRTYEVASPVVASRLPHVTSSADNFRDQEVVGDDQDTYRDRQGEPETVNTHPSDLADDLHVPYPFDTQAGSVTNRSRYDKPPSPPVQTTPPPQKEPATSFHGNSNVYAVSNPDIVRAQGTADNSYSQRQSSRTEYKDSEQREVKFNSAPRKAESRDSYRSPLRDRAPTPYAATPDRDQQRSPGEYIPPRSPADWDAPNNQAPQRVSRQASGARSSPKQGLPPQHPPLDHQHSRSAGKSRGSKRSEKLNDNNSVKRVYVESPSFTKEEEDEYRFVSSRLEDIDEKEQKTFREMDPKRRGYGGDDDSYARSNGGRDRYAQESRDDRRDVRYEQDNRGDRRDVRYEQDNRGDRRDVRYEQDNRENRRDMRYEQDNRDSRRDVRYEQDNRGDRRDVRYEQDRGDRYEQDNRDERRKADRYEDRNREMNGYRGGDDDRYEDRDKSGYYDERDDRYGRLKAERDYMDREPQRGEDPPLRGFGKQNTEMDERDLRQEVEYQRDLKKRLEKQSIRDRDRRQDYEPVPRNSYDKENFARDSLDYPDERDNGRQEVVEYNGYQQENMGWVDPPQNPYQEAQDPYYQGALVKQDSKPDFYDAEDAERMEIVNPKPTYDYVEHNKVDYGRPPPKSYRQIIHKKKEEEEKLDNIFITPKVQPKNKRQKKTSYSAQPEHLGHQPPVQNPYPLGFKPSSAEELWAKKAAQLTVKKDSSAGSKKQSAGKNKPKWNTSPQVKQVYKYEAPPQLPQPNSGVYRPPNMSYGSPQDQRGYSTPTRHLQPLENRPEPPVATEMMPTAVNPASPYRRHMELKPITQEITTEDGQRISVDINLRLISPPPGQGSPSQQLAMVPVQETQGQERGIGVPYQMQDPYGYDNGGYAETQKEAAENAENAGQQSTPQSSVEKKKVKFGDTGQYSEYSGNNQIPMDMKYQDIEEQITAEELALADPAGTGYSRKYQSGAVKEDDGDDKSLEEGYAALYSKMKHKDPNEHPWYKVYNLNDYKKMQREVRLSRGTLGPDLDTEPYKEKMEKRHKQFEYARMVMEKNRQELQGKKPPQFPRQPPKQGEENVKRRAALEYSKNVPKPVVKPRPNQYNSYEVSAQVAPGSNRNRASPLSNKSSRSPQPKTMDVLDIQTLQQRHLQERKNTDKIRQNMDSVLSQKAQKA